MAQSAEQQIKEAIELQKTHRRSGQPSHFECREDHCLEIWDKAGPLPKTETCPLCGGKVVWWEPTTNTFRIFYNEE